MKKLFLFTLIFGAFACSETDNSMVVPQQETTQSAPLTRLRSEREAIVAAIKTADKLYPKVSSRSARTIASIKAITSISSRSGDIDTLIYVVNFEDNGGYALISAPRAADEVLAVVGVGAYDPEEGSDNPGLNFFLDAANDYVSTLAWTGDIGGDTIPRLPTEDDMHDAFLVKRDTIAEYGGRHHIPDDFGWGQGGIYGAYCSNKLAGCGPVAIATIMAYINSFFYPTTEMQYTFTGRDLDSEVIDWPQIYKHRRIGHTIKEWNSKIGDSVLVYYPSICHESSQYNVHKTIGRIMRQIGQIAGSNYDPKKGTGTDARKVPDALKRLLPTPITVGSLKNFNSVKVMQSIDRGLLYMSGATSNNEGHAWVADGYYYIKTNITTATWDFDKKQWYGYKTETRERSLTYFHWGWHGHDDGYYANNVFETSAGTFDRRIKYIDVLFR